MKDVAADTSEIARTVAMPEKTDTAKTHETVDTADVADTVDIADIASAHGPWLPLPVIDVSDVHDISVAAPQLAPDSIYRTSVTALSAHSAPPNTTLPALRVASIDTYLRLRVREGHAATCYKAGQHAQVSTPVCLPAILMFAGLLGNAQHSTCTGKSRQRQQRGSHIGSSMGELAIRRLSLPRGRRSSGRS